jgi:hypothetical protein
MDRVVPCAMGTPRLPGILAVRPASGTYRGCPACLIQLPWGSRNASIRIASIRPGMTKLTGNETF